MGDYGQPATLTWENMTDAQKLENVRRWRDYYKDEREAAEDEIVRLEKEIERLKFQNAIMLESIQHAMVAIEANTVDEPPNYYQNFCIVTSFMRGEWGNDD